MKSVLYPTRLAAVQTFGRIALPLTERSRCEHCAAVVQCKHGYQLGRVHRGFHNNVIPWAAWIALCSLFCGETTFVHTHPHCACHAGERFSGRRDERSQVVCMGNVQVLGLGAHPQHLPHRAQRWLSEWDGRSESVHLGTLTDEASTLLCTRKPCVSRLKSWFPKRL